MHCENDMHAADKARALKSLWKRGAQTSPRMELVCSGGCDLLSAAA